MKRKAAAATLSCLLALVLTVQPSYAVLGIFDIVYDPTVEATIAVQTAMLSTNWVQQLLHQVEQIKTAVDTYIKLKETYDKIKETYDLAKKMSQYLNGLDAYALALGQWQGPGSSQDLFGATSGIQMAMGGALTPELAKSYGDSTNPLNSYGAEALASMSSFTKDRIKANASTISLADAASQQAFATVGGVAGAIAGSEPRVAALTSAALSDDPDMNTHAALLNRINVASAYSLAGQHDANKLLAVIANSQAVLLKEQRERYADEINRDIYLKNNFTADWEWASKGAAEAYKAIRISDYTSF